MAIADSLPPAVSNAMTIRTLRSGENLFRQGEPTVGIYEVVSGVVRMVRIDREGNEAVVHVARGGDALGEATLFTPIYHCDTIATTRATVRLYPKALLLSEFKRDPKFAEGYAAMLARQVMTLRTRLERRNIRSARDRVRHYLVLSAGRDGCTVQLPGTLIELAAELGLTHEVLYRTLARMAADGEIERNGSVIKVKRVV